MTIEKGCKYLHLLINYYLIRAESSLECFNWATHIYGCGSRFLIWYERKTIVVFVDMYIYIYISHFSA